LWLTVLLLSFIIASMPEDLFSSSQNRENQPLAYRMSPRNLDEYIGQEHIVGQGRLLRRVIQADRLSSLIFYGPPGTGKTSLARVIARTTRSAFTSLNAVLTGVKELREALREARERRDLYDRRTILFVDEVHRWNKAQQDALLPWVENGTVILIGATTQNPYFEVNSALVSRSRIFQLTPLSTEDLRKVAEQALGDRDRGYGRYLVDFEEEALEHLIEVADGDARSLLNALELAVETSPEHFPPAEGASIRVSMDAAEQSIQKRAVLYDKEGDYHFDIISAFIKSIRGSDPDAALYWLARMVHAGEDPHFIFRRLLISASEDVGMADPHALGVVEAAAAAFDRVGMPEGRYHLAHAVLYLSTAPKSNSSLGFFDALDQIEKEATPEVPGHLRDANRDRKGLGHGEGYLYPHAYRDHWVSQQYLPESLQGKIFYRPTEQGYEAAIRESVSRRREAQLAAGLEEDRPEILTYSPPDHERDQWIQRILESRGSTLAGIRSEIFRKLRPSRHARICVIGAEEGTLVWEALRQSPEGGVTGIVTRADRLDFLRHYGEQLDPLIRPVFRQDKPETYLETHPEDAGGYEAVIGSNVLLRSAAREKLMNTAYGLLSKKGRLLFAETLPSFSTRLSVLAASALPPLERDQLEALAAAETALRGEPGLRLLQLSEEELRKTAEEAGFTMVKAELQEMSEQRSLRKKDIERWLSTAGESFDPSSGESSGAAAGESAPAPAAGSAAPASTGSDSRVTIGTVILRTHSPAFLKKLTGDLAERLGGSTVDWSFTICYLSARKED
jgi:putative ATPase